MQKSNYNHPSNLNDFKPRYWVLDKSLELESKLSFLIKSIMRISKHGTKTLDNKSSTLQYKSKVDLLYDLENINKVQYNQLIKFGEIRNQFVHNHSVENFIDLAKSTNNLGNYLQNNFTCKTDQNEEIQLRCGFHNLQTNCILDIEMLIEDYEEGKTLDVDKYISNQIIEDINYHIHYVLEEFKLLRPDNNFGILIDNPSRKSDVEVFAELMKIKIDVEKINLRVNLNDETQMKEVFSRKE